MGKLSLILSILFLTVSIHASASITENVSEAKVHTSHWFPGAIPQGYSEYQLELAVWGYSITSVTVEGPNVLSKSLEYKETLDTDEMRWTTTADLPGKPSVGDTYNFTVKYNNLSTEVLNASVLGTVDEFPAIISPAQGSIITTLIPTFEWTALTIALDKIGIFVMEIESSEIKWVTTISTEQTKVDYNFDEKAEPLETGKSYIWILECRDSPHDDVAFVMSDFSVDTETKVEEAMNTHQHSVFYLPQNYPNPFNPITTIEYSLLQDGHVTLAIYNISGQVVSVLKDEYQQAGNHSVIWNASETSSGLYFCTLQASGFTQTRKMVLVK